MPFPITSLTYGTYQYILREVAMELRWGDNDALWNHEQQGELDNIVQRGIRRFYSPPVFPGEATQHAWSFLRPVSELDTTASYNTGTVTIASGVVTLSDGTWPSAAADGDLSVGGSLYSVDTRDSGTQITLDDTTVTVATASEYTLGFYRYDLPSDFVDMIGPLTYAPSTATWAGEVPIVSEHQIRRLRQSIDYFGYPRIAAIRPRALDPTTGSRFEILFWPIPEDAFTFEYRYEMFPGLLTTTNQYPYGGLTHANTWVEACLAEAEMSKFGNQSKIHEKRFMECLRSSIEHDRQVNCPEHLGNNNDYSDIMEGGDHLFWTHRNSYNVTAYEGRTW